MAEDITISEEIEAEVQDEATPLVTNDEAAAGEDIEAFGPDTDAERVAAEEDAEEGAEELEEAEDAAEVAEEVAKAADADPDNDGDDDTSEEGDDDADAEVTKADDAEEADDEDDAIAKAIESLEDRLTKALDTIAALEAVANRVDEIGRAQAELTEKFAAVNDTVDTVKKSYDAVEKTVGLKKSGDLGGSKEDAVVEKSATTSKWGGRFFGSVGNI